MNRYLLLGSAAIIAMSQLYEQMLNNFNVMYPLWLYIDIIVFVVFLFSGIVNKQFSYILALVFVLAVLFIYSAVFYSAIQQGEHIKTWWLIRPASYLIAILGCVREIFTYKNQRIA